MQGYKNKWRSFTERVFNHTEENGTLNLEYQVKQIISKLRENEVKR